MILTFIMSVLFTIINVLLIPIDAIINALIPNFGQLSTSIVNFFNLALTYIGNAMSMLGINSVVVGMLIAFWTFKLTAPVGMWLLKLIFKWWHAVKG